MNEPSQQVEIEMPKYKCHKEVWALKIEKISGLKLSFSDEGYDSIIVEQSLFSRYIPVPGDYYVIYEDGYKSISPAKAFENGYSPINRGN